MAKETLLYLCTCEKSGRKSDFGGCFQPRFHRTPQRKRLAASHLFQHLFPHSASLPPFFYHIQPTKSKAYVDAPGLKWRFLLPSVQSPDQVELQS
jgi:hypothetical protein